MCAIDWPTLAAGIGAGHRYLKNNLVADGWADHNISSTSTNQRSSHETFIYQLGDGAASACGPERGRGVFTLLRQLRRFNSPIPFRGTHDSPRSDHGHFGRRYSCACNQPAARKDIPRSHSVAPRPIAVLPDARLLQWTRRRAGNLRLFRLSPVPTGGGGYARQLRSEQRLPRGVAVEAGHGVELEPEPERNAPPPALRVALSRALHLLRPRSLAPPLFYGRPLLAQSGRF
jgi:hypothetical protein